MRGGRQILASILLGGPSGPAPVAYRDEPYYDRGNYYEPAPYAAQPYEQVVYHEHRHDVYHHYPVAYREHRGGHPSHWKHKQHRHHRGCHH